MSEQVLQKIKSKGYWRIQIEPYIYRKDRLTLSRCRNVLEKSEVRKRGWPYPYVFRAGDATGSELISNTFYQNSIEWTNHIEIWRFYRSGQFVHYSVLREDWSNEMLSQFHGQKVLEIVMTLYTVTEIFLFMSNLSSTSLYDDGAILQLELHDVHDRQLVFYNTPYRGFRELHNNYQCKMDEPIKIERTLKKGDIISSSTPAMDVVEEVFEKFNWSSNIREILKDDQVRFIKGLI